MKKIITPLFLMVNVVVFNSYIGSSAEPEQPAPLSSQITSAVLNKRWLAAESLKEDRKKTITTLLRMAETEVKSQNQQLMEFQDSPKHLAIALLGELRAVEGVEVLIKNIALLGGSLLATLNPTERLPAVQSLIQIGSPSVKGILTRLAMPTPVEERDIRFYALVIHGVDGYDVGLYRLQSALRNKESSDVQKQNIVKLIEVFEHKETSTSLTRYLNSLRKIQLK